MKKKLEKILAALENLFEDVQDIAESDDEQISALFSDIEAELDNAIAAMSQALSLLEKAEEPEA